MIVQSFNTPEYLNKRYFPSLDGWRAVAILIVLLDHLRYNQLPGTIYSKISHSLIYGHLGVRIFFVLSGFLITILIIKEFQKSGTINSKRFYIKRILRIFPALYLYLIVLAIVNYFFKLNIDVNSFLVAAFYVSNFQFFDVNTFTGHTWSLSVEEQYYLIWPLVFLYLQKRIWVLLCFVFIVITCLRMFWYYYPNYQQLSLKPFLSHVDSIFMGALFAFLSFKNFFSANQTIWKNKLLVILFGLLLPCIYFCISQGYLGFVLLPFGSIILNLIIGFLILRTLIHSNGILYKILNAKVMVKIGIISYSIYIWQQLFIVPYNIGYPLYFWQVFPLNIILSFTVAYLSHHYYESYFIKIKNRWYT